MAALEAFFQKIRKTSIFDHFIDFTRGIDRSGAEVSRRTIRFLNKSIFFIYRHFFCKKDMFLGQKPCCCIQDHRFDSDRSQHHSVAQRKEFISEITSID